RLARRGVALSAALTAAALTPALAGAAVPVALSAVVVNAAVAVAAGRTCAAVSAEAAALAKGVTQAMLVAKLKWVAGVALVAALVLGGGGLLAYTAWHPHETGPAAAQPEKAQGGNAGQAKTDAYGDPLPPGVLARMGSARLRHAGPVHQLVFTASGKL